MDIYKNRKLKKFQNPQVENGHIDIVNEIMEALIVAKFTQLERSVIDFVIRKTWGYCDLTMYGRIQKDENGFIR